MAGDSEAGARMSALQISRSSIGGGDAEEDERRAVLEEDEFEDEDAMFAVHSNMGKASSSSKSNSRLLFPVLSCVLLSLTILAVLLYFLLPPTAETRLEQCVPANVTVPVVSSLTLAEKVGQMMQIDHLALKNTADVANYFIGSILSGGGGAPAQGNTAANWADMVDDLQAKVSKTRLQIPIVYGADAVHGHNNVLGATIFPHHVGMGASRNPQLMQRIASLTAKEVMGTGVRWTFSPAVSVCQDPRWGRCYESFSQLSNVVTLMALPEILGFQVLPEDWPTPEGRLSADTFIAATAKHFVGDGGTTGGKDRGDTECGEAELREVHMAPYVTAIASGVSSIMVSYSSWHGEPMHQNRFLLTDVLRAELGFEGVLVSDWGAVQLLPGNFSVQVMNAINAGIDMVMVPTDYKAFSATLIELVNMGYVSMERIDEAVGRILKLKQSLGLFENACAYREFLQYVGSDEHRKVAREAVRETLVLLKNNDRRKDGTPLFPLKLDGATLLVVGSHANNIGLQCGGWTITWQGSGGRTTTGTTILEGIQAVAVQHTNSLTVRYEETYDGESQADYGIVVVGEWPYAEYGGDSPGLSLNKTNLDQIDQVCSRMPCIVVLVTGRALDVWPLVSKMDALVVAWLPGSEGGGVADVLVGDYDFKGRLPFNWFKNVDQLPLTLERSMESLYTNGFGLDKSANPILGFP